MCIGWFFGFFEGKTKKPATRSAESSFFLRKNEELAIAPTNFLLFPKEKQKISYNTSLIFHFFEEKMKN
jgi:hypothetical protein